MAYFIIICTVMSSIFVCWRVNKDCNEVEAVWQRALERMR